MSPIPEPTGWPSIKGTYDTYLLEGKLRKDVDNGKTVTKEDRLAAIEYWMDRLLLDAITTSKKGKP